MGDPNDRLMSEAVREALDSVVAPGLRDAILGAALAETDGHEIPVDVSGFRAFVRGPLRRAVALAVGEALTGPLMDELERIGCSIPPTGRPPPPERRSRGVSRSRRPSGPHRSLSPPRFASAPSRRRTSSPVPAVLQSTPPFSSATSSELPPPGSPEADALVEATRDIGSLAELPDLHDYTARVSEPSGPLDESLSPMRSPFDSGELPFVLEPRGVPDGAPEEGLGVVVVATRDQRLLRTLKEWLRDRARVVRVSNILDLMHHVAGRDPLLVIDCNRPSVRPVAVAALAEELPTSTRVILWSPSEDDEQAVSMISPVTASWERCELRAAASLAQRCAELVS